MGFRLWSLIKPDLHIRASGESNSEANDDRSNYISDVNIKKFSVSIRIDIYSYFQYFFIISTKSVSNIKLLRCFLIIFPKLIQHLFRNFSNNFLKIFTRSHKNIKMFKILLHNQSKIAQKFSTNFQHFFKVLSK